MVAYLLAAIGRTLLSRGQYREAVDCLYGAVDRLPNDKSRAGASWGRHSSLLRWLANVVRDGRRYGLRARGRPGERHEA